MNTSALLLATFLKSSISLGLEAQEVEQMGSWYYQAQLDPITDVNSSTAITRNDDEEWVLGIHCSDGGYGVAIAAWRRGSVLKGKSLELCAGMDIQTVNVVLAHRLLTPHLMGIPNGKPGGTSGLWLASG